MPKYDPEREAHRAWLGLLQPVGLVVSPPALMKAGAVLDKNVHAQQEALHALLETGFDFPRFAEDVLHWQPGDLAEPDPSLSVPLPDYGETLRPTWAVCDPVTKKPILLIEQVAGELDVPVGAGWTATPQARLERVLRDTGVPAGLLVNGTELRLVYAPRGETSGHLGFPIPEMDTVGGRGILSACLMLLGAARVFDDPNGGLLALLSESRKYQSEVSNRLAEQVLEGLWELLRGFQAADEAANHRVLWDLPRTEPQTIYGGLLTVIMRLVFLLYAEDQGLMPQSEVYARNYSVGGLFLRLREDAGRHPDTMDQRFGAWATLLSTFRLVHDGGHHGDLQLPERHGQLFDPNGYPFLEGRPPGVGRVRDVAFEAPRVSDGVLWRVLEGLLLLDGERLSYRALDVEQIGSVYESMMGFDVRTTAGPAIAVRPKNVVVDLDRLLEKSGAHRAKWLDEEADCSLAAGQARALAEAGTVEDVVAALGRKVSALTPHPIAPGGLFLQPGQERRRSGSHYTPRELTEPIVRTTLRPVLEALGERPRPEAILDLKVCDPAMGSGAFLVEACRQLAEKLVESWNVHRCTPPLPPDEPALLHARRLVAQKCLYGVDKNPFAVNLAKLSLWLVTLAKDHAFTFLDHALKHGDSLVGLTRDQIGAFHWSPPVRDYGPLFQGVNTSVAEAAGYRARLQSLGEGDYDRRKMEWQDAEDAIDEVRLVGDLCVAAFFAAEKDKDREAKRVAYRQKVDDWRAGRGDSIEIRGIVEALRTGERAVPAFHWEIEFPEVFGRANPGFDAMVGNPPFAGRNTTFAAQGETYVYFLIDATPGSHGSSDLVGYFFRRVFALIRRSGTMGLIATNTISQGDTRTTGLGWITANIGTIYEARRRVPWPGKAAVVVSVVHIAKCPVDKASLDGRTVGAISRFLLPGSAVEPCRLTENRGKSFMGNKVYGQGFVFDDADSDASPISTMKELITRNPRNGERIFEYIGGEEITRTPRQEPHRYVINFNNWSEEQARGWPDLMAIIESRVRPEREKLGDNVDARRRKANWWHWGQAATALSAASEGLDRVLAASQVSAHLSFSFQPARRVVAHTVVVVANPTFAMFTLVQSRPHETWARFLGSSMKDDLRYTPSDCFETFPFPQEWEAKPSLEATGEAYFTFRADVMIRRNEGLTATYNRFHDPDEREGDVVHLRELHAAMDRAVLDAYGWHDIPTDCEFRLDYEIDEETWGNKKKPWRYRWPEAVHDEVLARLLDLNQKRYEEEVAAGLHAKGAARPKAEKKPAKLRTPKAAPSPAPPAMFAPEDE